MRYPCQKATGLCFIPLTCIRNSTQPPCSSPRDQSQEDRPQRSRERLQGIRQGAKPSGAWDKSGHPILFPAVGFLGFGCRALLLLLPSSKCSFTLFSLSTTDS